MSCHYTFFIINRSVIRLSTLDIPNSQSVDVYWVSGLGRVLDSVLCDCNLDSIRFTIGGDF